MGFQVRMLNGVGVVATSKRNIKPGFEFENYFPRPGFTDPVMTQDGSNEMTIDRFIPKIVRLYLGDTEKIAVVLKQSTLEGTLKSLFDFIYTHIQYKMDSPYEEQIRRPARSWADRHSGVDCDCYTVFISSVLTNLRIPHYLRMTAYKNQRGYQHIYVVVPKKGGANMNNSSEYFTVDPVMDSFNTEKPFIKKRDKLMDIAGIGLNGFPIRMLNGNNNIVFANRTDLVEQDVYYSPVLDTWALKGLDGGYYIEGDYNRRFIEPLNGDGLYFINTGVGVDGFFKKLGKVVKKVGKAVGKVALPMAASIIPGGSAALNFGKGLLSAAKGSKGAKGAPQQLTPINQAQAALPVAPGTMPEQAAQTPLLNTIAQAAGFDPALINNKIVAANKATVMSLSNMDKSMKDRIDIFGANFSTGIKKVLENTSSVEDVLKNVDKISTEALRATASVKQQQAAIETQTSELLETNKAEKLHNEQFRNEQRNMNRITTIALVALGILLLIIILKQTKK